MNYVRNPNNETLTTGNKVMACYTDHGDSGSSATTGVLHSVVDAVNQATVESTVDSHFGADDTLVSATDSALMGQRLTLPIDCLFGEVSLQAFSKGRQQFQG